MDPQQIKKEEDQKHHKDHHAQDEPPVKGKEVQDGIRVRAIPAYRGFLFFPSVRTWHGDARRAATSG